MTEEKTYIAIDLKSFYASVECIDRGLDPLTTNLVVADASRTEKTICLAVSPSLKAYGIPGRARLFEVVQKTGEINAQRRARAPGKEFGGSSVSDPELKEDPSLELDYIVAPPRMARYIECSTVIYSIYIQYASPEDIHVYSIDEVFIDATRYLRDGETAYNFAMRIIHEVLQKTGITATAGIGTNLYLCKIAMDIVAKHIPPDKDGVRVASLNEMTYRELLWEHRPLTDFWRVGRGYAAKLEANGMFTMGDVARCSLGGKYDRLNPDLLYKLFGVNAELLIDHAWGYEPCTIAEIKAYRPSTNSLCCGQVLSCAYEHDKAAVIVREMADSLALDLVDKGLVTEKLTLTVNYDTENISDPARLQNYRGEITLDYYGRRAPKHAHGTANLPEKTSSSRIIVAAVLELFERITDHSLSIRRLTVSAEQLITEQQAEEEKKIKQYDLFTDPEEEEQRELAEQREKRRAQAMLSIKKKYGKNAIVKGTDLQEGATAMERNSQIGGHRA